MLKITMLDSDVEVLINQYFDQIAQLDKRIAHLGLENAFSDNFERIRRVMGELEERKEKGLIPDHVWEELQIYIVRSTRLYIHFMPYFEMMDQRLVCKCMLKKEE